MGRVVKEGFSEEMTFEQKPECNEEEARHRNIYGKRLPDRSNSKHKDVEVRISLTYTKNSKKTSVTRTRGQKKRVIVDMVRKTSMSPVLKGLEAMAERLDLF